MKRRNKHFINPLFWSGFVVCVKRKMYDHFIHRVCEWNVSLRCKLFDCFFYSLYTNVWLRLYITTNIHQEREFAFSTLLYKPTQMWEKSTFQFLISLTVLYFKVFFTIEMSIKKGIPLPPPLIALALHIIYRQVDFCCEVAPVIVNFHLHSINFHSLTKSLKKELIKAVNLVSTLGTVHSLVMYCSLVLVCVVAILKHMRSHT